MAPSDSRTEMTQPPLAQGAELHPRPWGFLGQFRAMASPCELLIATSDVTTASHILNLAAHEAKRIETKYSRFITHNPLWQLNHGDGSPMPIDAETHRLLSFAQQCYSLSDGRFDISAGPLMQLWRFEDLQHGRIPSAQEIDHAKSLVDFSALHITPTSLQMPKAMSLDFGGIAKEYAVDNTARLIAERWPALSVLVNFGGDIACPVARTSPESAWQVGIENPNALDSASALLQIRQGALATSGTTRRYLEKDHKRYGHIVDPSSGFPVANAPLSVTVLAQNCVMAGMLSTMAMLEGANAEAFLTAQGVYFQVYR